MTDRFCTAYHPAGFKQYGIKLVESYDKFSLDLPIHVWASHYMEDPLYHPYSSKDGTKCIYHEQYSIPELRDFQYRYKNNPEVQGKKDNGLWKDKDRRAGYNYRFDLLKFSKMIYVMWAEAHRDPTGRMVWLDGDCLLRKQLPDDFIDRALPEGYAYSYLGRGKKYSETGFLVFDLPQALPILDEWASFCTLDSFLEQPEQHSAFLFDRARERHPDIKGYDLTPNGGGHPIYDTWVGEYIHHLKGSRKDKGFCPQGMKHEQMIKRNKK